MGFSCGIVGLPNVGKSTLYNALTKAGAASSNYPFCTIDPNVGIVPVPDERLLRLGEISKSKKITPTTVEFVDIAGLVAGASKGEGLGNQFLSHIRNVDAIVQVVRLFEDEDVVHIGQVDPVRDVEIINTELILKDLETVENIINRRAKLAQSGNKEAIAEVEIMKDIRDKLGEGKLIKNMDLDDKHRKLVKHYQFLTDKPLLLLTNISESQLDNYEEELLYTKIMEKAAELNCDVMALSARLEQELTELDEEEAQEYMADLGMKRSGLEKLIIEGYKLLGLITFFTTGEKESRAWTIPQGATAPQAAGVIHTDFEKGFIRAEATSYENLDQHGAWNTLKEKGLMRMEGKDYIMRDGDVVIFHFSG